MVQSLIGITVGEITNVREVWTDPSYGQRRTYIDAIVAAGGTPIMLPLLDNEATLRQLYKLCAGIVLSGGNDVDPAQYGEELEPETKDISPKRDEQERLLIKWALKDNKPVLGICRGMQLLNVALGGSLYQDIARELPAADNHTASVEHKDFAYLAHTLSIKPDSQLAKILGTEKIETNALHHQAIRELSDQLTATAWTHDDIIEAVELPTNRFVVAVQSHPESLTSVDPRWQKLFTAFVENTR